MEQPYYEIASNLTHQTFTSGSMLMFCSLLIVTQVPFSQVLPKGQASIWQVSESKRV